MTMLVPATTLLRHATETSKRLRHGMQMQSINCHAFYRFAFALSAALGFHAALWLVATTSTVLGNVSCTGTSSLLAR